MSTTIMWIFPSLFFVVALGQKNTERLDPMNTCTDSYGNRGQIIEYREKTGKCSFVCIINGKGDNTTTIQQPDGLLCYDDLAEAKENNWMCYKGQCVTKDAWDTCKKIVNGEENIASLVYNLCNVYCLAKGETLPSVHQFKSLESCYSYKNSLQGKFGKCNKFKECKIPNTV